MPVIRQKPERFTRPINVTRTNTGGAELWETISNNAGELTNIVLKKRERQSLEEAKDIANLYTDDEITALDPVTNEPKVLSEYNFNPQADAAFERIIQQRFSDTINTNIQLKDKELYIKSETAEAYKKSMSQYLAELSNGVENGEYKNLIESIGTQRLSLTHLNFLADEKKRNEEKIKQETKLTVNSKVDEYINNLNNNIDIETLVNNREDINERLDTAYVSGSITFPQKEEYITKIQIAEASLFLRQEYAKKITEREKVNFISDLVNRPEDFPFFKVLDTKSRNSVLESLNKIKQAEEDKKQLAAEELKTEVEKALANINDIQNEISFRGIHNKNPTAYARAITNHQTKIIEILDEYKEEFSKDDYNHAVTQLLANTWEPLIQDLIFQTKTKQDKSLYSAILSRGHLDNVDITNPKAERILSDILFLKSVYKNFGLENKKAYTNLQDRFNTGLDETALQKITNEINENNKKNNALKFNAELNKNLETAKNVKKAIENYNNIVITGTQDNQRDATLILRDNLTADIQDLGFEQTQAILEHLQLDGNSELPLLLKAKNIINAINDTKGDFKSTIIKDIDTYVTNYKQTASFGTEENKKNLQLSQTIHDFLRTYTDNDISLQLKKMSEFQALGKVEQRAFKAEAQNVLENLNVKDIFVLNNDEIDSLFDYVNAHTKDKYKLKNDLTPRALVIAERLDANLASTFAGGTDSVTMNEAFRKSLDKRKRLLEDELEEQKKQQEQEKFDSNWEKGTAVVNDKKSQENAEKYTEGLFKPEGLFGDNPTYDAEQAIPFIKNEHIGREVINVFKQIIDNTQEGDVGDAISSIFYEKDGQRIPITPNQFSKLIHFAQEAYNKRKFDQWGMDYKDVAILDDISVIMNDQKLSTYNEIVQFYRQQRAIPKSNQQIIKKTEQLVDELTGGTNNQTEDGEDIMPPSFFAEINKKTFGQTSENVKRSVIRYHAQYFQPEIPIVSGFVNTGLDSAAINSNQNIASSIMAAGLDNGVSITPKTTAMYLNDMFQHLDQACASLNKQAGGNFKVCIAGDTLAGAVFPDEITDALLNYVVSDDFANIHSDSWYSPILKPIDYLSSYFIDGGFTGQKLSIFNERTDFILGQNAKEKINEDGTRGLEIPSRFNIFKGAVDALVPDKFFGKAMFWHTTISPDRDLFLEWAFGQKSKEIKLRTYLGTISNDVNNASYQGLKKWLKDNYAYDLETMRISLIPMDDGFLFQDSNGNLIPHSTDDPNNNYEKGSPILFPRLEKNEELLKANAQEVQDMIEGGIIDYKANLFYIDEEELLKRQERIKKEIYRSEIDFSVHNFDKILFDTERNRLPIFNWFTKNKNTIPYVNNKPAFNFKKKE